ncbi:exported hypothetical protein [Rhodospirillaceae bacterium LM-1]|nr:exported hypothetical protein [Rhodospirillaceae bacterium LM-1]
MPNIPASCMKLALALPFVALFVAPAFAASLSCKSAEEFECGPTGCERQTLHTVLLLDFKRQEITYCAGEGCYGARVVLVKAQDGGISFAFDAKPEERRRGERVDRLVTIHPGRKNATVGNFLADGTVLFSRMSCEDRP